MHNGQFLGRVQFTVISPANVRPATEAESDSEFDLSAAASPGSTTPPNLGISAISPIPPASFEGTPGSDSKVKLGQKSGSESSSGNELTVLSASGGDVSTVQSASGGDVSTVQSASGGDVSTVLSASGGDVSTVQSASGGDVSTVQSASGGDVSTVQSASGGDVSTVRLEQSPQGPQQQALQAPAGSALSSDDETSDSGGDESTEKLEQSPQGAAASPAGSGGSASSRTTNRQIPVATI